MTARRSLVERLTDKIVCVSESGCWEWTGSRHPFGYGRVRVGGRGTQVKNTHRVVWELVVGPIPAGLQLDHLCKNPPCCNPAHLEVVTPRQNVMRSASPMISAYHADTCLRGHPFTPENTYRWVGRPTYRQCLACKRLRRAKAPA